RLSFAIRRRDPRAPPLPYTTLFRSCRHPRACEQLFPVQAVDAGEEIRCTLDEADESAHRDRNAPLGEVASDAIERRQQTELLVDEPSEPVASDLGALVRRGQ